jgi:hypothetical protein
MLAVCTPVRGGGRLLKKSKFSEEQIAYVLRQAESGTAIADVCVH